MSLHLHRYWEVSKQCLNVLQKLQHTKEFSYQALCNWYQARLFNFTISLKCLRMNLFEQHKVSLSRVIFSLSWVHFNPLLKKKNLNQKFNFKNRNWSKWFLALLFFFLAEGISFSFKLCLIPAKLSNYKYET